MTNFIILCVSGLIALMGVLSLPFVKSNVKMFLCVVAVLGGMIAMGCSTFYETAFANCPCRIAHVNVDGTSTYETVKAVWPSKHYVNVWRGGLNFDYYNHSQIRF